MPCGYSTYFTTFDALVKQLRAAEVGGQVTRKLKTYLKPALLIVDEVGYPPLERKEASLVFQRVSGRYEKGFIILTSTKTCAEWSEVFSDEVLVTAMLDRLLHYAEVFSIRRHSYRLRGKRLDGAPRGSSPETAGGFGTAGVTDVNGPVGSGEPVRTWTPCRPKDRVGTAGGRPAGVGYARPEAGGGLAGRPPSCPDRSATVGVADQPGALGRAGLPGDDGAPS